MNNLIKLVINTIYGDLVSPYFNSVNTIVGNNITALARSMAWHLEKGVHGFQTITDGCCFELNKVIYKHRYNVNAEKLYNHNKGLLERKIRVSPLMGKKIALSRSGKMVPNYKYETIEKAVEEHLKELFPNTKVVRQFKLEVKEICDVLITHGASNYQTRRVDGTTRTRMRSYSKRSYKRYLE